MATAVADASSSTTASAAAKAAASGGGIGPAGGDVDSWLATLREGKFLEEGNLKRLCAQVVEIMVAEANVRYVPTPVTICGDLHGKFYDVLNLFQTGGEIPSTSYIFMGDYVDRGKHNVETIQLLLCLKARYPDHITLIRGNHETRAITKQYGFYDECVQKYGNANSWAYCMEAFDYFNIAAVAGNKIFCVHGGLSPDIPTIDQIQALHRVQEIPRLGTFADLVWSDPEDKLDTWALNPRGAGYLYGGKVATEFCRVNDIDLIARSHQLVNEGYKYHFEDECLATVWSCPNYCYRCGNKAAILAVSDKHERTFLVFEEVPEEQDDGSADKAGASVVHYFL